MIKCLRVAALVFAILVIRGCAEAPAYNEIPGAETKLISELRPLYRQLDDMGVRVVAFDKTTAIPGSTAAYDHAANILYWNPDDPNAQTAFLHESVHVLQDCLHSGFRTPESQLIGMKFTTQEKARFIEAYPGYRLQALKNGRTLDQTIQTEMEAFSSANHVDDSTYIGSLVERLQQTCSTGIAVGG